MSIELLLLVATAVLAVVAVAAALVAVRASRPIRDVGSTQQPSSTEIVRQEPAPEPTSTAVATVPAARIVEGRVIVAPSTQQVVEATLGRPLVRISVLSHGLAHALRPESRDRIMALMRREFQGRRRARKRAARQAARREHPVPERAIDRRVVATEAWLGELPPLRDPAVKP